MSKKILRVSEPTVYEGYHDDGSITKNGFIPVAKVVNSIKLPTPVTPIDPPYSMEAARSRHGLRQAGSFTSRTLAENRVGVSGYNSYTSGSVTQRAYTPPPPKTTSFAASTLHKLQGVKVRDLFASHATRIGMLRGDIVSDAGALMYVPRSRGLAGHESFSVMAPDTTHELYADPERQISYGTFHPNPAKRVASAPPVTSMLRTKLTATYPPPMHADALSGGQGKYSNFQAASSMAAASSDYTLQHGGTTPRASLRANPLRSDLGGPALECADEYLEGVWHQNRSRMAGDERLKSHARELVHQWGTDKGRLEEEMQRRQESALYAKHARTQASPAVSFGGNHSRPATRAGAVTAAGSTQTVTQKPTTTNTTNTAAAGSEDNLNDDVANGHVSEEEPISEGEGDEEDEVDHNSHWGPKAWTADTKNGKVSEWVIAEPPPAEEKKGKKPSAPKKPVAPPRERIPGVSPISPTPKNKRHPGAHAWETPLEQPPTSKKMASSIGSFSPYTTRMTEKPARLSTTKEKTKRMIPGGSPPTQTGAIVGNGGNPGGAAGRARFAAQMAVINGALSTSIPEVVGSSYQNTMRKVDLLQVDKIKYQLATEGVSVPRGTLERALIGPQVTFSDADKASLLPTPFVGLAPYPIPPEKKKKAAGGKKKKKK